MRRRLLFVFLVLGLVALVPYAQGAAQVVNATGALAGGGTSYQLTVTNTGDEVIRCFAVRVPPGTTVTAVGGPAGWITGTGASGGVFGGQTATGGSGIAPGQSATFTFSTAAAYPVDPADDLLFVSATCAAGSDRQGTLTGPRTPVSPPPGGGGGKPCKCAKMSVKLDGTLINKAPAIAPDDHDFGVGFQWFLTCSAGSGKCKGTVSFSPPEILAGELPKPKENLRLNLKKLAFVCQGNCATSKTGRFEIKMLTRDQLRVLFGRTLAYTVKTKCAGVTKTTRVRVSINQNGKLRVRP
jgi:hypothetical protein